MKLGNHTIGLRKRLTRLDGDGQPVRDDHGDKVIDVVDVEVRWCLVTPTTRSSDIDEPEDRAAPMTSGMTLLAPPGTDLDAVDVVVWPITGRETVDDVLQLSGPVWQISGDPEPWPDTVKAQLLKAT